MRSIGSCAEGEHLGTPIEGPSAADGAIGVVLVTAEFFARIHDLRDRQAATSQRCRGSREHFTTRVKNRDTLERTSSRPRMASVQAARRKVVIGRLGMCVASRLAGFQEPARGVEHKIAVGSAIEVFIMKSNIRRFLGASVVALSLGASGFAHAEKGTPANPPDLGIAPSTAVLFTSSGLGRTGDFAGTIVDLSCGTVAPSNGSATCTDQDRFALELDGERTRYPLLLVGGAPVIDQLRAGQFTGRKVRITGVHYSTMGTILVSDVHTLG